MNPPLYVWEYCFWVLNGKGDASIVLLCETLTLGLMALHVGISCSYNLFLVLETTFLHYDLLSLNP